ncbi:MAG: hypothetical protein A3E25_16775 [Burkholderiales bacterium RIFCSPHIGHO2_12_FULL_69_20]|nr:MAG: hypothetical protein A3E25_16775 [Burkholderiales bacterium RIFCSPHIGHO2_12_FULL_69_20]
MLRGLAGAATLTVLGVAASAAPVLGHDDADSLHREPALPAMQPGATPHATLPTMDRALSATTSTGNKNLDLLLELQGHPDAATRQAAPVRSAAAASAAAAELAALRAKAARRPTSWQDTPPRPETAERQQDQGPPVERPKPGLQLFEGTGTALGDLRAAPAVPRREWVGQPSGSAGHFDTGRDAGAPRSGYDADNPVAQLLRDTVQFLRENRLWLLGTAGALAVLGAALKAYSRRV